MSSQNLLERTGRGITSALVNVAEPSNPAAQRERGAQMIKNLGLGGTMLGGGTAAVVAAIGLLSALRKEREMEDDARLDDDTLYISDPHKAKIREKAAAEGVSPLLAPGLAMTSGIVGAGAGYALVQGIYNALEKRRRRALLDEAQREALGMADVEAVKAAAATGDVKINLADLLTGTPVALPLLTMLATGGLTYAALDKSFPTVSRPKRTGPRRIRVGKEGVPYEVPDEDVAMGEETEKSAFHRADLEDAGDEFLASFVAASRPDTITGDFIAKAASGELEAMEELLKTAGIDTLLVSLKGAGDREISQDKRMLGAMTLFKSAALKDTVRSIAAAEYIEIFGDAYNEFSGCPRTMQKMASLGCLMGIISRDSALPELAKEAAVVGDAPPTSPGVLELLKALIFGGGDKAPQDPAQPSPNATAGADSEDREDRDAALTSDAGGGIGGIAEDGAVGSTSPTESTGDNDVVDTVLAPGLEAAIEPTD